MGQAGDYAHQHRLLQLLREGKGLAHHVVSFLLVAGLKNGYHGKLAVEAAVLLVLAGVHRRVVGCQHYEAAVYSGDGTIYESIGAYVHAHVLHADKGTLAGIAHAEGCLHGRFLVGGPVAVDAALLGQRVSLNKFGNLGAWSARISVNTAQTCVDGTQRDGLVSE